MTWPPVNWRPVKTGGQESLSPPAGLLLASLALHENSISLPGYRAGIFPDFAGRGYPREARRRRGRPLQFQDRRRPLEARRKAARATKGAAEIARRSHADGDGVA